MRGLPYFIRYVLRNEMRTIVFTILHTIGTHFLVLSHYPFERRRNGNTSGWYVMYVPPMKCVCYMTVIGIRFQSFFKRLPGTLDGVSI